MKQFYLKTLLLCAFAMVGMKAAAYDCEVDGIYYNLSGDEATVTFKSHSNSNNPTYTFYEGNVIVPSSIKYEGKEYTVTTIGQGAFTRCEFLRSVQLPNTIKTIQALAFSGSSLLNIEIPSSVNSIGDMAFYNCQSLIRAKLPDGITAIGSSTFSSCFQLSEVNIPSSVKTIDSSAFRYCSNLSSISIPNGVTKIGSQAFINCSNLKEVNLPSSVNEIGGGAFWECENLKSISIPNGVTAIQSSTFYGCKQLASITIPSSVVNIEANAFNECVSLSQITVEAGNLKYDSRNSCNAVIETASNTLIIGGANTVIPNGVTAIGGSAFSGKGIKIISLPKSVESIGEYAFSSCSALASITVDAGNDVFDSRDNCNAIIEKASNKLVVGCSTTVIPNSVTTIGESAFAYNKSLSSIVIPDNVETIEAEAFTGTNLLVVCKRSTPPTAVATSFSQGYGIVPSSSLSSYQSANGWKNLTFNSSAFSVEKITQTTITLTSFDMLSDLSVKVDGTSYTPVGGKVVITGLTPYTEYTIETHGSFEGISLDNTFNVTTLNIIQYIRVEEVTNTTITLNCSYDAGDVQVVESGFEEHGKGDRIKVTGLKPGNSYWFYHYITSDKGETYTQSTLARTIPVGIATGAVCTASSSHLKGYCSVIDATVTDFGFTDYPQKDNVSIHGLDPNTTYTTQFYVETEEGGRIVKNISYTTDPLTLTTSQPKVISEGNVIIAAESNIDDAEENVGFEWRRQDWPDNIASNTGAAYLYEGTMEGYIRNMNANYLWKFRPYYLADSGTYYYGDWVGLDPSNTSFFEPTVHTYATITVEGNSALVKGYALRGTDNVKVQGFKYWKSVASAKAADGISKAPAIPGNALSVEASGQVMTASLENLDYETTYSYAAFVTTTEGETFYGEVQTFTTPVDESNGVENVTERQQTAEIVGYYDLQGKKLNGLQRGLSIIRMKDGTTKKVFMR